MITIKIKKLYDDVKLPTKAHKEDACYDIYAYTHGKDITIYPHEAAIIDTGFCTEIPTGYFCPVYSRSGMGFKQDLRLSNCTGIIDSSYRNEWKVKLYNDGNINQVIMDGDRIAQFTILPVLESELIECGELSDTDRGLGGFGSTGR